jgi:hypothetical protein
LVIGFIEHLQIVTTSTSSAIANSRARAKSSLSAIRILESVSQLIRRCYATVTIIGSPPGATVCDDFRWVCLQTASCRLETLLDCGFKVEVEVEFEFEIILRLTVYRQSFRLGVKLPEVHEERFFLQLKPCCPSPYATYSLTRRYVCPL